jgi:hypothetical protein
MTSNPRLSVVAHVMSGDAAYRLAIKFLSNVALLGPRPKAGQLQ